MQRLQDEIQDLKEPSLVSSRGGAAEPSSDTLETEEGRAEEEASFHLAAKKVLALQATLKETAAQLEVGVHCHRRPRGSTRR